MKEALFLLAVQGIVGGIEIENDSVGSFSEAVEKNLDEQLFDRFGIRGNPVVTALSGLRMQSKLDSIQRAFRGQGRTVMAGPLALIAGRIGFTDGGGEQGVDPEPIMIVEVFISQRQTEDPLPQQLFEAVLDAARISGIDETIGKAVTNAQFLVQAPQCHNAGIRRKMTALEISGHNTSSRALQLEAFGFTVCIQGLRLSVILNVS